MYCDETCSSQRECESGNTWIYLEKNIRYRNQHRRNVMETSLISATEQSSMAMIWRGLSFDLQITVLNKRQSSNAKKQLSQLAVILSSITYLFLVFWWNVDEFWRWRGKVHFLSLGSSHRCKLMHVHIHWLWGICKKPTTEVTKKSGKIYLNKEYTKFQNGIRWLNKERPTWCHLLYSGWSNASACIWIPNHLSQTTT